MISKSNVARWLSTGCMRRNLHTGGPETMNRSETPNVEIRRLRTRGLNRRLLQNMVYIGLGSNVGNRIGNIERACRELDQDGLRVRRTSALYETAPMYFEDQASFINGVCEAEVPAGMHPLDLLSRLQAIEKRMGRQKFIDKGPRNIDLDILLHGDTIFNDPTLNIPHIGILERGFVLHPLCDLIQNKRYPKAMSRSFGDHLRTLIENSEDRPACVAPLSPHLQLDRKNPRRRTHIMAILNLTPDSFSDGSLHSPSDHDSLISLVQSFVSAGASVLDVGGQSTAPKAPEVSAEEELSRVLPAIKLLRSRPEFSKLAISIDTYRSSVARAAIEAGADIVNDVSAGTMDPDMLSTVADLGCTYIMMHMRGTPATMTSEENTQYPLGVIGQVRNELKARVRAAMAAGIRRWRIVLDPGIGFAKLQTHNLELLYGLGSLGDEGLNGIPWLVGPSRKGFVGRVTGVKDASQRKWGTAGCVTACVAGGADIVRVHDVAEMSAVVKMADAICRRDPEKTQQDPGKTRRDLEKTRRDLERTQTDLKKTERTVEWFIGRMP